MHAIVHFLLLLVNLLPLHPLKTSYVKYFLNFLHLNSVKTRKSSARTYLGTRTRMFGEQTDAKNRKTGNRNNVKTNKVSMIVLIGFF